jgi:tetratricopeptide (TPR) repeat protein
MPCHYWAQHLKLHHTNTLGGVIVGNRGQIMSAGVLIIKSSHRISKAQLKAPVNYANIEIRIGIFRINFNRFFKSINGFILLSKCQIRDTHLIVEAYKKSIEIKPKFDSYYRIGIVYSKLKQYQKSLDAYQKALTAS